MPARRRAPPGCGPQARWRCCSLLTYRTGYARRSRLASGPGGLQQNVKLFLREPLATDSQSHRGSSLCVSGAEHLWMAKIAGEFFSTKMKEQPLRTTVVGSYPFPGWLEFASQNLERFGAPDVEELIEDAVKLGRAP